MEFPYYANYGGPLIEAYEKSLMDVIQGDQTLFWREDAVETCWSYFSPIIEGCEDCPTLASHIQPYPAGTWGPVEASQLLEREGRKWITS